MDKRKLKPQHPDFNPANLDDCPIPSRSTTGLLEDYQTEDHKSVNSLSFSA